MGSIPAKDWHRFVLVIVLLQMFQISREAEVDYLPLNHVIPFQIHEGIQKTNDCQ